MHALEHPILFFIGLSTGRSSIMSVFPTWTDCLGLGDCRIAGIDLPPHAPPAAYREVVGGIKTDPRAAGAVVTAHKIDLFNACRDLFDEFDPNAQLLGEVSAIGKRNGRLVGMAKDPLTSGLALNAFLPSDHWRTGAEACILGAGGAAVALAVHLLAEEHGVKRPVHIVLTDRSAERLDEVKGMRLGTDIELIQCSTPPENDAIVNRLPPGSLVVNATGLGKDAPGSPLTDEAIFPESGYAWDFNYRGDLLFLTQARAQQAGRRLHVEDGWGYFIHGWAQAIAAIFHIAVPTCGPQFDELCELAMKTRDKEPAAPVTFTP
jgi:shikimate 5-dehydrogenase